MKTFRVWTHNDVAPWEVDAENRKDALSKGLALAAANPPTIPVRDEAGYYCDENGNPVETHFTPARPATPCNEPFARVKPKPSTFRRW